MKHSRVAIAETSGVCTSKGASAEARQQRCVGTGHSVCSRGASAHATHLRNPPLTVSPSDPRMMHVSASRRRSNRCTSGTAEMPLTPETQCTRRQSTDAETSAQKRKA